jgi:hypothetical protein
MINSSIRNIYFLFTTGRTGTALLSQCFGFMKWEKRSYRINNDCVVVHEPWFDMPIEKLKLVDIYSKEAFNIVEPYIDNKLSEINSEFANAISLFITDHKIGRYFGPYILNSEINFKVIYINRDENDVAKSFEKKRAGKEKALEECGYNRYIDRMWSANKYHPSDFSAINKVDDDSWSSYSNEDKFLWHANETKSQWQSFKRGLDEKDFLELFIDKSYHIDDMRKISRFLGLSFDQDLFHIRAN